MRYGNCLIGLLILMLQHGFAGTVVHHCLEGVPHFGYRVGRSVYHYRRYADVAPYPLSIFFYCGRLEREVGSSAAQFRPTLQWSVA